MFRQSTIHAIVTIALIAVTVGVAGCAGAAGTPTVLPTATISGGSASGSPSPSGPAGTGTASPTVPATQTAVPSATPVPSPTPVSTAAAPSATSLAATPTVVAVATAPTIPTSTKLELTSQDSGQSFVYGVTTRFTIILDGQTYPKNDLTLQCDQSQVLGAISNLPAVAPPSYAVRYEGVNPGVCAIADRDFTVTVRIVGPPAPIATTSQTPTVATPTPGPASSAPPGTTIGGSPPYLDDRSDPVAVVRSYYNAIDRQEYDRAYSYWQPAAAANQIPPYPQFKAGYADTRSVQVTIGDVRGDAGAGQRYGSVPVALVATLKSGATQSYVGCYTLHLAVPVIQDAPPFQPWTIQSAVVQALPAGSDAFAALATACAQNGAQPGSPVSPTPTTTPSDISASRYLDDRSTPEEVLRSLFNAVNRQEYDRAYSYWEPNAAGLPSYAQFKQGYQATASVDLTLGTTSTGVAAGNLYFRVPVVLVSHQTDGTSQTFSGCYTVHLGQPAIQDQPPFQPMAIQSAAVQQVTAGTDPSALLGAACG